MKHLGYFFVGAILAAIFYALVRVIVGLGEGWHILLLLIPLFCWFDLCEKGAGVSSDLSILTIFVVLGMMFVPLGIYWAGKGAVLTYKL